MALVKNVPTPAEKIEQMRPSMSIFIFLEVDRDEELFDECPFVVERYVGI